MKKTYLLFIVYILSIIASFVRGEESDSSMEILLRSMSNYSKVQNFQSPNVSTFNVYGNIPVSLYTGTPNISIPLYIIETHNIDIPIELRYNINNVKPNTRPGVTGLGWNLFAGGSITRIERGGAFDEKNIDKNSTSYRLEGFLYHEDYLSDNWANENSSGSKWYDEINLYKRHNPDTQNGLSTFDLSPDKFTFNFLNYSGSFYRNHHGEWVVDSQIPFKVSHNLITYAATRSQISSNNIKLLSLSVGKSNTIESFRLEAPDGMVFIFGGIDAIDYSVGLTQQTDYRNPPVATTWHLKSIITPNNKKEYSFRYKQAAPIIEGNYHFTVKDSEYDTRVGRGLHFQIVMPVFLESIGVIEGEDIKYKEIAGFEYEESVELKYLDDYFDSFRDDGKQYPGTIIQLTFMTASSPKGFIKEFYEFKWSKLTKIRLPIRQEYIFNYTNSEDERLKLLSLEKKGINEESEKYTFTYNSTELPDYLSGHYDHLGFYNGSDFTFTFQEKFFRTPSTNPSGDIKANANMFYSSRHGDKEGVYVKAETLEKITYPTGGYSIFEYEPHNIHYFVNGTRSALIDCTKTYTELQYPGGLRIKKIQNYDFDEKTLGIKCYYYVGNFNPQTKQGISSGVLGFQPQYYWDLAITAIAPSSDHYNPLIHDYKSTLLISGSTSQAYYNLGDSPYVGYSEVIECSEDEKGNINGYTKYKYTNFEEGFFDEKALSNYNDKGGDSFLSPNTPFTSHAKRRGAIISIENYDKNNILVHRVLNKYKETKHKEVRDLNIGALLGPVTNSSSTNVKGGGSYVHKLYNNLLSERTEETIIGTDTIKNISYYEYNIDNLISKQRSDYGNFQGNQEVLFFYTGDLFRKDNYFRSKRYTMLENRYMYSLPIEKVIIKDGHVVSSEIFDYYEGKIDSSNSTNQVTPHHIYRFRDVSPIPLSSYKFATIEGDSLMIDSRNKSHLKNYSYSSHPVVDYQELNSGCVSYLWGYNAMYPIAKIENVKYEDVLNAMGYTLTSYWQDREKGLIGEDWEKINNLRKVFPHAHITTYTYQPYVGMTSLTDPKGFTIYYKYDGFNHLKRTYIKEDGIEKNIHTYEYHYKNQ